MQVLVAGPWQQDARVLQTGLHHPVYHRRDDGVGGHVAGDIRLGVVGTLFFLALFGEVDVLLEDEPQNVRVDLVVPFGGAFVEMPAPIVEETENLLEHRVADLDVVGALQVMLFENAAVHVGHLPDDFGDAGVGPVSDRGRSTQALMEQRQQVLAEEGVELVRPEGFPHLLQSGSQVMKVAVHEPLALDEVDEHEPVQQDGGIPAAVAILLIGNALDPFGERPVILLKLLVEALGHLVDVERPPHPFQHLRAGQGLMVFQVEPDPLQPLQQGCVGFTASIVVVNQSPARSGGTLLGPKP